MAEAHTSRLASGAAAPPGVVRPAESIQPAQDSPAEAGAWWRWFDAQRAAFDDVLSAHMNGLKAGPGGADALRRAVQYSSCLPAKRVRPVLVLEACRVAGGSAEAAIPAALAIECVHAFSLIHDDLPAMDDDDLRRGQPTNHKVFGEALAILAGDWLCTHAFSLLASHRCGAALVAELAAATQDMIVGQAADIVAQGQAADGPLTRFIHLHKTARLIEAACGMGAIAAGASSPALSTLRDYGRSVGLAFQIVDDLLDATGTSERMGKRVAKDAAVEKQTYPAAFGEAESRRVAREQVSQALSALTPFGPRADYLRGLAEFVLQRDC